MFTFHDCVNKELSNFGGSALNFHTQNLVVKKKWKILFMYWKEKSKPWKINAIKKVETGVPGVKPPVTEKACEMKGVSG